MIFIKGGNKMQTQSIKQEAYRILDKLPDKATWDDLMYQIYVRQTIEAGIKDSEEGRTVDVQEVRKRFGLTK
jgi:predicted transcriptional regulator